MVVKGYIRFHGKRAYYCPSLGWRRGQPGDVDSHGEPVESNYVVFVRIKDCRLYEDERGMLRYDPNKAPQAFAVGYGGTFYGYNGDYAYVSQDGFVYRKLTERAREREPKL
jgi:hypothetical protein